MNLLARTRSRCIRLFALAVVLGAVFSSPGQRAAPIGLPDDWTHHHVVFSNPGTAAQAIAAGDYARWARVVSDPRFLLQQKKRAAAAAGRNSPPAAPPAVPISSAESASTPSVPEDQGSGGDRMNYSARGVTPVHPLGPEVPFSFHRRIHKRRKNPQRPDNLHPDWSVNMGAGATAGIGVYPAKYSFGVSTANCADDFVVYNTGLTGSASQASIIAFNNLYTGCTTTPPSVYWAYDTAGGTVVTSVTLSLDGSQVAFVQSSGSAASLVILKWASSASESASSPDVLANTAAASYRACSAPCMTVIPFSNGANDSGSSVYTVYSEDTLYVGDDTGMLHKFTGVFLGTPAEASSPWPVNVNSSSEALSSPVVDPDSGNILVGDYLLGEEPNCSTAGCGFFYNVNPTSGAVIKSARLDYVNGLVSSPVLDVSAATVYVFVGADSGFLSASSPCGVRVPCSGVFQFSTTFASGAEGIEAPTGAGFQFMLAGALDNQIFTSANPGSPTGNLYVIGDTGNANNTLYQIPISSNVMGTPVVGPAISSNYTNGYMAAGMGLTEIFNGTNDYVFTSALIFAAPLDCTSSLMQGCVMGFDVTSGTISASTSPIGASTEAGGASGIIIDNIAATGSNIYFTTLADQLCTTSASSGGCAIQSSQSSP